MAIKSETKKRYKVSSAGRVVERSMQEYGHYVLEERALADIRDGFKPVQRRILWATWERLKLRPNITPKKSARVTGETCGLFHPHGDLAVYQTLVNMSWDNHPLLEGKGNFGDPPSKKPPAAARYTSVKATKLLSEVFKDVAVTPLVDNYTGEVLEPALLPSRVPALLLNGSEGIAVGVTSNIPPHNLEELVRGLLLKLRKPMAKLSSLRKYIKGPDYPQGGRLLSGRVALDEMYEKGKGSLEYLCDHTITKVKNGYSLVVKSSVPNWSLPRFLDQMNKLASQNLIGWVSNESGENIRVVVFARERERLRKHVLPRLRTRIRYNWVALDNKKPVYFNLDSYLTRWLEFRRRVAKAHLEHKLQVLTKRIREEQARLTAVKHLDDTIKAIRSPKPVAALKKTLGITTYQAKVILRSSIRLLTRLGEQKQKALCKDLEKDRKLLRSQLKDIDGVVKKELQSLLAYKRERRTKVSDA